MVQTYDYDDILYTMKQLKIILDKTRHRIIKRIKDSMVLKGTSYSQHDFVVGIM